MQDFEVMIPVVLMMIVECLHRALKEDVDILASDLQQANPKNGLMHVTIKREKDKLTCNMIRYSHVLKGKWNGECAKEIEKKIEKNIILPLLAVAAAAAFFAAFFFCFSSSALILATLSTLHSHA